MPNITSERKNLEYAPIIEVENGMNEMHAKYNTLIQR